MSIEPTQQDLEDGLHTLRTQGGGMLELEVIQPSDSMALLLCARADSVRAQQTLTPVMSLLKSIGTAPRKVPRLCGSCPRAVRRNSKFSIVVAWPSCDAPSPNNSLDRPKSAQATKRLGQRFHCKKLHQTARSHSSKRCQRLSLDRAFLVNNAG